MRRYSHKDIKKIFRNRSKLTLWIIKKREELLKIKIRQSHKRCLVKSYDDAINDTNKDAKVKTITNFVWSSSNSVKSLAVGKKKQQQKNKTKKRKNEVKVTTKFMNGKILTFARMSLASFKSDMIDMYLLSRTAARKTYICKITLWNLCSTY